MWYKLFTAVNYTSVYSANVFFNASLFYTSLLSMGKDTSLLIEWSSIWGYTKEGPQILE
jgi:hypothetical protein